MTNSPAPVLPGQRYGQWTVVEADAGRLRGGKAALCWCDCGTEKLITHTCLRIGRARRCRSCAARSVPFPEEGQRFGKWTVVTPEAGRQGGHFLALCRCDCGAERPVRHQNLQMGISRSCGCLSAERITALSTTHGLGGHPLYMTYYDMIHRCENPKNKRYRHYGGRGITVWEPWRGGPAAFIAWMEQNLGPKPTPAHSIDRIDNDGNYEPGNLRWATPPEQLRNRRPAARRTSR